MSKLMQKSLEITIFFCIPILFSIWYLYHFHSWILLGQLTGPMYAFGTIGALLWTFSWSVYSCYKEELSSIVKNDETNNSNNNNIELVDSNKQ